MMLSFHNQQQVKNKYIERVQRHAALGNIIQGLGWEDGKGGAVGCTLEYYDYENLERYRTELGLPVWLAILEEHIFDNLPPKEARIWPEIFLQAIPVGVDINLVYDRLAIKRLDRLIFLQKELIGLDIAMPVFNIIKHALAGLLVAQEVHQKELDRGVINLFYDDTAQLEKTRQEATLGAVERAVDSASWAAIATTKLMKTDKSMARLIELEKLLPLYINMPQGYWLATEEQAIAAAALINSEAKTTEAAALSSAADACWSALDSSWVSTDRLSNWMINKSATTATPGFPGWNERSELRAEFAAGIAAVSAWQNEAKDLLTSLLEIGGGKSNS